MVNNFVFIYEVCDIDNISVGLFVVRIVIKLELKIKKLSLIAV